MSSLERAAPISDVHGNLTTLEAVLADVDARGVTRIVNLGYATGADFDTYDRVSRT
jgi:hypothetical protein